MINAKLYTIAVDVYGPTESKRKTGRGRYVVCEKSEEMAIKCLRNYFKENNLTGDINYIYQITDENKIMDLNKKTVIKETDYFDLLKQSKEKSNYVFEPKKSEKGMQIHKINRPGKEKREINIQGAFGNSNAKTEKIEDCGTLKDIDGVTYNGEPLSNQNVENLENDTLELE